MLSTRSNIYPRNSTILLQGKKVKNSIDILAALALNGPSTTRGIANFIIKKIEESTVSHKDEYKRIREQIYYKLIAGRLKKRIGKRKYERYPGLYSEKYVAIAFQSKNEKMKLTRHYYPTIKGCIFLLGVDFSKEEFIQFFKSAAKHHLSFAYLNTIVEKTSFSFVRDILLEPTRNLIKSGMINLDMEFWLSFNMIADASGKKLYDLYFKAMRKNKRETISYVEKLIDNTWYDETDHEKWVDDITKLYSKNDDCYFLNDEYDTNLLYCLMRSYHLTYYHTNGFSAPLKYEQKLPRSSKFKE